MIECVENQECGECHHHSQIVVLTLDEQRRVADHHKHDGGQVGRSDVKPEAAVKGDGDDRQAVVAVDLAFNSDIADFVFCQQHLRARVKD